jgi:hypothetical protein
MKRIYIIAGIVSICYFIYFIITPIYLFKHYYSFDRETVLTRVTQINVLKLSKIIYLTPGYYTDHKVPDRYVKPVPATDGEWIQYAILHTKGILIIGDSAETKNLSSSFIYISNSFTDYGKSLYIDSLEKSLKGKKSYHIHSFD